MQPGAQGWCQSSDTEHWSQSPVPAPSSKEGVKGKCPALGSKETNPIALDFSCAQAVPQS